MKVLKVERMAYRLSQCRVYARVSDVRGIGTGIAMCV